MGLGWAAARLSNNDTGETLTICGRVVFALSDAVGSAYLASWLQRRKTVDYFDSLLALLGTSPV